LTENLAAAFSATVSSLDKGIWGLVNGLDLSERIICGRTRLARSSLDAGVGPMTVARDDLQEGNRQLWSLAASEFDATWPIHTITEETSVFD
jgi:hypothetical protein